MKKLILLLGGVLFSLAAYCQENAAAEVFTSALWPTQDGAVMAFTGQKQSFVLSVQGAKVTPGPEPGWFYVDGQIFQASAVPVLNGIRLDSLTQQRQHELLQAYIGYELAYFKNELQIDYQELKVEWATLYNKPCVFWYFTMPPAKGVQQQLYLSTLCFNQTLSLNAPVLKKKDFGKLKRNLAQLAASLQLNDYPLDLEAIQKKLN